MQLERVIRFVVRQKRDRPGGSVEAIAHADSRMIHELRTDLHLTDLEFHGVELLDDKSTRQVVESYREKRRRHLASENFMQAAVRPVVAINADQILVVVGRNKEREPLDVVPMNMRN